MGDILIQISTASNKDIQSLRKVAVSVCEDDLTYSL